MTVDHALAQDLENRFTYHPPKDFQPTLYSGMRSQAHEFAMMLTEVCPESRELSLAITKLEEVVFWANAAIARRT